MLPYLGQGDGAKERTKMGGRLKIVLLRVCQSREINLKTEVNFTFVAKYLSVTPYVAPNWVRQRNKISEVLDTV